MFRKLSMLVCGAMLAAGAASAQLQPCSADEHYHKLVEQYPQLADYQKQFEAQLAERFARKTTSDTTLYTVPIVVHVIHDYGVENLSDDALYQAAAYWTQTFLGENSDTVDVIPTFKPYVGTSKIRLRLATIDPKGRPTKGIDRINSYLANIADDQAKYNQWPQNQYVNIWLVGTFGASVTGAAAYAILPATVMYEPMYDGIIALSSYANPSTKTIPHEMGHVLNLQHPWGSTNNPGVACGDDYVDDTPPTLGHMPAGCSFAALYDTTCATSYMKYYVSMDGTADSLVDYPDTANSQNIMDYTYCQRMFTIGQVARMRATLESVVAGRNNLVTPANLAATGALAPMPDLPPVADFVMNHASSLGSNALDKRSYFLAFNNVAQFVFRNASWNDTVSDVQWIFSNGASTPTSTSATTVTNSFSQPGWVTTTLIANSNAGSDTLVNTHSVYAADTTPAGTLSYTQDFADEASIANWPMFNYYNNQFKWEFYNGAGVGDNSCIRYRSWDTTYRNTGIAIGDHDDIYTPAFDLSGTSGTVYFNFFTAGAYTRHLISGYDPQQQDSLEVDASTNGGAFWSKVAGFHLSDLENNGQKNTEFVPTAASNWKPRSIAIPTADLTGHTYFRFRVWPGNMGNNLYIDKMSLSPWPAGVKEVLSSTGTFDIYPNPASNGCNLIFKTGTTGLVKYAVTDITGKTIYTDAKQYAPDTIQQAVLSRDVTPAPGLYFVTLNIDGLNVTQKLVIY